MTDRDYLTLLAVQPAIDPCPCSHAPTDVLVEALCRPVSDEEYLRPPPVGLHRRDSCLHNNHKGSDASSFCQDPWQMAVTTGWAAVIDFS